MRGVHIVRSPAAPRKRNMRVSATMRLKETERFGEGRSVFRLSSFSRIRANLSVRQPNSAAELPTRSCAQAGLFSQLSDKTAFVLEDLRPHRKTRPQINLRVALFEVWRGDLVLSRHPSTARTSPILAKCRPSADRGQDLPRVFKIL